MPSPEKAICTAEKWFILLPDKREMRNRSWNVHSVSAGYVLPKREVCSLVDLLLSYLLFCITSFINRQGNGTVRRHKLKDTEGLVYTIGR